MRTILTPPCECGPGDLLLDATSHAGNPSPSDRASEERQAELAAIVALALPIGMPTESAALVATSLRQVVAALPPMRESPGDRAMARDLLAAADALDLYGTPDI